MTAATILLDPNDFTAQRDHPVSTLQADQRLGRTWKKIAAYDTTLFLVFFINIIRSALVHLRIQKILPKTLKVRDWYNKIESNERDFKIVLGALPLKNLHHIEKISHIAQSVLTMVEKFEVERKTIFSKPVTPGDWAEAGIDQLQLETPDFKPVFAETLRRGVEYLTARIAEGKNVYVHCKAGRGRSAAITVSYVASQLMIEDATLSSTQAFDKAVAVVKGSRPTINVDVERAEIIRFLQIRHL